MASRAHNNRDARDKKRSQFKRVHFEEDLSARVSMRVDSFAMIRIDDDEGSGVSLVGRRAIGSASNGEEKRQA